MEGKDPSPDLRHIKQPPLVSASLEHSSTSHRPEYHRSKKSRLHPRSYPPAPPDPRSRKQGERHNDPHTLSDTLSQPHRLKIGSTTTPQQARPSPSFRLERSKAQYTSRPRNKKARITAHQPSKTSTTEARTQPPQSQCPSPPKQPSSQVRQPA